MKKFTKGCLITALILFVFGCAFWGVCGYMGGFRQLENLNLSRERILSIGWNGIRFGYNGNWFGIWDDDFDDDWWEETSGAPNLVEVGDKVRTDYHASAVTDMDIELGGSNLVIQESEDEYIWIANDSTAKTVKYEMKNGIFKLYYGRNVRLWNDVSQNGNIYLYLPKNMNLNDISLDMGAGKMESIALTAEEIDIEVGAGTFTVDGLYGNDISIQAGAGKIDIQSINARNVSAECGAGEIRIDSLTADVLDLEAGMGNIDVNGSIERSADVECSMGNVNLTLQGTEQDYDYELDCALGNISIGTMKYTGISEEKDIYNGSGRIISVECSAGNININFAK